MAILDPGCPKIVCVGSVYGLNKRKIECNSIRQ